MRQQKHDLTEGSVGAHIRRLAMAMGWGIVAMNVVQFTDMYFISRLGHDALAAISFTFPVTGFLFFVILAMSSGMTSAIARAAGGRRHEQAARTVTAGLAGSALIGLCLMVTAFALHERVFLSLGAPAALMPLIGEYMHVWYAGIPFMALCVVANAGTRGAGEGRLPAMVMVLLALTNLLLSPFLVFGFLGLPAMGMRGSALATFLAYGVATGAALHIASHRMRLIRFRTLRNGPKTKRALRIWLSVVIPVSAAYSIEPFASGVLTACAARIGLDAVSAFGVATRIESIALIMLMALWGAVTPMTGQNWAARKYERVRQTVHLTSIINGVFCFAFAAVMWIWARPIVALFSELPQTIALATLYLTIVPISYVGFGASGLVGSALNGVGRAPWYLVANVARVLLLLSIAVYGGLYHGFFGFSLGIGAANLLAGAIIVVWSRRVFLAPGAVSDLSLPSRSRSSDG